MKLEFDTLNSLLHVALGHLCSEDCIIPGAANLPPGTELTLEMTWPDGEQPVIVQGTSRGLDPGGRGLRLELRDPPALQQVIMLMTHLHFGPHVGRRLLARFGMAERHDEAEHATLFEEAEPPAPAEAVTIPPAVAVPTPEEDPLRTVVPGAPSVVRKRPSGRPLDRPSGIRPPRLRPPVLGPSTPAAAARTELPHPSRGKEDEPDLSRTAIVVSPELLASLDDLDDDY